jgi:hypothetical protein
MANNTIDRILKDIRLKQLRKERELIQANKKAWIKLHAKDNIDASVSRTFLAYQNSINRINESIRRITDND